jgi:hypothetical protein
MGLERSCRQFEAGPMRHGPLRSRIEALRRGLRSPFDPAMPPAVDALPPAETPRIARSIDRIVRPGANWRLAAKIIISVKECIIIEKTAARSRAWVVSFLRVASDGTAP